MNKTVEEYFEDNKSNTNLDNFEILIGLMFAFGDKDWRMKNEDCRLIKYKPRASSIGKSTIYPQQSTMNLKFKIYNPQAPVF